MARGRLLWVKNSRTFAIFAHFENETHTGRSAECREGAYCMYDRDGRLSTRI